MNKNIHPTLFMMRDLRFLDFDRFAIVDRQLYKRAIRLQDKAGQPFVVGTEYRNGRAVKKLTLLRDETVQQVHVQQKEQKVA